MNERRIGLEKDNGSVEPAKDGRRPQLALEASNIRTGSGRRGSGVDMCSKEKRVNMGSPRGGKRDPSRKSARNRPGCGGWRKGP